MGKTKPPYPAAFKQQIVELFQAGRSQSELAREFDVSAGSIAAGWPMLPPIQTNHSLARCADER